MDLEENLIAPIIDKVIQKNEVYELKQLLGDKNDLSNFSISTKIL